MDGRRRLSDELHRAPSWLERWRRFRDQLRRCPPGWVVGGGSATNFITYPGPSVTTIQVKFDDPGWLGLLKAAQDSGSYSEQTVADIVMYAFLNLRAKAPHRMEAPAGEW